MFEQNITENEKIGNFPTIESLVGELERIERAYNQPCKAQSEREHERDYERSWAIRALINATPARSRTELQAKARAFRIEAARDEDFECHVPGSAQELAKSLTDDLLMMFEAASAEKNT